MHLTEQKPPSPYASVKGSTKVLYSISKCHKIHKLTIPLLLPGSPNSPIGELLPPWCCLNVSQTCVQALDEYLAEICWSLPDSAGLLVASYFWDGLTEQPLSGMGSFQDEE
ncbi:hypothetical protein P7K49_004771 [Saguinus oedipus]|uniref:Uncharacterized protein n=1 Tax=Saguinus oedipus TaxID=9490 RepID=A0ABQ9W8F6_SAGOE|nr:hypothetical protein P7K49_004771 [Saguinus oedipus]